MRRVSIVPIVAAAILGVAGAGLSPSALAQQTPPISTPQALHHCVHASGYIACAKGTWKATLVVPPTIRQGVRTGTKQPLLRRVVRRMRGCLLVKVQGTAYITCNKRTWKVTRVVASKD